MVYSGKIGSRTVYASKDVIVLFQGIDILEFDSLLDAMGFVEFYNKAPAANKKPARIYTFISNAWVEYSS